MLQVRVTIIFCFYTGTDFEENSCFIFFFSPFPLWQERWDLLKCVSERRTYREEIGVSKCLTFYNLILLTLSILWELLSHDA